MASFSLGSLNHEAPNKYSQKEDTLSAFESLKTCFSKLDHSPQNFKASVGRSGTHGQRRPPSRCSAANSIISSKSSNDSFDFLGAKKEITSAFPKVVNVKIHLEDSEKAEPISTESSKRFKRSQKHHSEESHLKPTQKELNSILESNTDLNLKEASTQFDCISPHNLKNTEVNPDILNPYISPVLLRLLYNSKAYSKKYNRSDTLSFPSLTNSTFLKKSESSSSLSALNSNHQQNHSQVPKNEDFFDSQSHHSDSCLTSSVLLRNILNSFNNRNNSTYRDSSSDTEVVISDIESLSDSGEVNRRTIIHINKKSRLNSNSSEPTDKNNNFVEDPNPNPCGYFNPRENTPTLTSSFIGTDNPLNHSGTQLNGYEKKSRMFVKQSDSSNRPSRPSAFNVRQTIEKRQIEQERKERKLLRKKLRQQMRSSSVGRKDTNSYSLSSYLSDSSNISKSLSSLDDNEDNNSSIDPLIKAQSNPTLESDKRPIRTYLFGTNLSSEPNNSSTSENINEENFCEKQIGTGKEYINLSLRNLPRETSIVKQDNSRTSLSDNCINQVTFYNNSKSQHTDSDTATVIQQSFPQIFALGTTANKNSLEANQKEYLPVPPPRRRFRISSSAGQLTVEKNDKPSWLRQAKERRSLRNERRPFDDLSEKAESVVAPEPQWVGKARKKLESMNVFLTSTTDTLSVSSVVSDSSAWSRGGLDALEDLKEEVGRMSDVLSEEALQKVESDLGLHYKERNMIEYPSIPEHPSEQQNYPLTSNDVHGKEEVRFGDLKHDWGGIQYGRKGSQNTTSTSSAKLGKENRNNRYNKNIIPSKYDSHIKEEKKTSQNDKLKITHFGDCPQDLVSKRDRPLPDQKSSKFESIRGPDPLTMSAEQLNQNVEEYDFPVPTGKEDSQTLLKILELSLQKEETVPEFTSDAENEPKPKSILKRRSQKEEKNVTTSSKESHVLDSFKSHPSASKEYQPSNATNSKRLYDSEKSSKISDSIHSNERLQSDEKLSKSRNVNPRPFSSSITSDSSDKPANEHTRHSKENHGNHITSLYNQIYGRNRKDECRSNYKEFNKKDDCRHLERTLNNNRLNLKLSEWEELQRQRLENENKNIVNKGTFIRPVSDKIKDLIRLHAGIKNVFSKERKNTYNGTVNAKEIIFQKIPSVECNRDSTKDKSKLIDSVSNLIKQSPMENNYIKSHEKENLKNRNTHLNLSDIDKGSKFSAEPSSTHRKQISTYLFNVPDAFSKKCAPFDRLSPKNKSFGSYHDKKNVNLHSKTQVNSLSESHYKFPNDKVMSNTEIVKEHGTSNNDKINPFSVENRNSIYRSSCPAYTTTANRLSDHNVGNANYKKLNVGVHTKFQPFDYSSKMDLQEDKTNNGLYIDKKNIISGYRFIDSNLKLSEEKETSKENICPNRGRYQSRKTLCKDLIAENVSTPYDSFTAPILSQEPTVDKLGNKRLSLTSVQNLLDRKYVPLERCTSPLALSDKSYILDKNRPGSPFSRISLPSKDRRHSLRSASSPRSTPDREGPISLSSILGRDTCSPYSSSNHLSASEELGKPTWRYRKNFVDRESPLCKTYSDNANVFGDHQPQLNFRNRKNIQKDSLKRKSDDALSLCGEKQNAKSSNKQVKAYLSHRKTPPRSLDRRLRMTTNSSRIQRKDSNKTKDRKITKMSIDKLATPKSAIANKKEKIIRIDSGASTRSERDEECEYYENINSKTGEGWAKTKIRKTKLGKPLREKRSLSRENSGSSSNSRHIKKASAELEKWAAQTRTYGKLVNKEGQRYSHEVEEEEKGGKKTAKAVSRKVVRRGSRRMLKGGEIVSETKEIAKNAPSKPPKALQRTISKNQEPSTSLTMYAPKDDITRKIKTKTDGERFTTTSVKTVKGVNTMTTEGVDKKTTKSFEIIGGRGWEGEREVAGKHGERVIVERHIGKGLRPSTIIKKASSNSKFITTKTKKSAFV